jgi:hypothetical protein
MENSGRAIEILIAPPLSKEAQKRAKTAHGVLQKKYLPGSIKYLDFSKLFVKISGFAYRNCAVEPDFNFLNADPALRGTQKD